MPVVEETYCGRTQKEEIIRYRWVGRLWGSMAAVREHLSCDSVCIYPNTRKQLVVAYVPVVIHRVKRHCFDDICLKDLVEMNKLDDASVARRTEFASNAIVVIEFHRPIPPRVIIVWRLDRHTNRPSTDAREWVSIQSSVCAQISTLHHVRSLHFPRFKVTRTNKIHGKFEWEHVSTAKAFVCLFCESHDIVHLYWVV